MWSSLPSARLKFSLCMTLLWPRKPPPKTTDIYLHTYPALSIAPSPSCGRYCRTVICFKVMRPWRHPLHLSTPKSSLLKTTSYFANLSRADPLPMRPCSGQDEPLFPGLRATASLPCKTTIVAKMCTALAATTTSVNSTFRSSVNLGKVSCLM